MKIGILTTETSHHAYFIREVHKKFPIAIVLNDSKVLQAPFEVKHPFESIREEYEKKIWFDGSGMKISDFAETYDVEDVNGQPSMEILQKAKCDLLFVFGTGKISARFITAFEGKIYNLHGGDPEEYRGLDSHLWAIYHSDFTNLITTLHSVNETLDGGEIVSRQRLTLTRNMKIHQLRAVNTLVCVDLVIQALNDFSTKKTLSTFKQKKIGRYYSFMPSVLKEVCAKKFERFTSGL